MGTTGLQSQPRADDKGLTHGHAVPDGFVTSGAKLRSLLQGGFIIPVPVDDPVHLKAPRW